ncbi:DotU family type VI secretion system protein [Acidovorax sp. GBBC 3332]|nr:MULTISPECIES: DotU family type VI secretion system protein [unclassified Acidovorax]MDA8452214.1 DotU family type VI secretion system protein [Acidovorax sp. GBBC 3297]MDA8461660.1 DotU family type VI secretion system protein [Acidovorax sp. GBBC 3333]MDA8466693.1 DotU family type VI secretion system protein [Acidovorax sp. GBBC 3332]MDA8471704.1 DotU family type VI secretion system protein [Acidovorax sp. GBBC 3299]
MSMQNSVNVFASGHPGQPAGAVPASAPPGGTGAESGAKPSGLPDVVSGGNPLVAAANTLLNLIPQIRRMATNPDPAAFQHYLLECIRHFESRAGGAGVPMETIIGARYCICTAIDEAAAQTPWGGSGVWPQYSLLVALHNETWGGEKFFQLLSKLVQTPHQHIDLIELMYFCLTLGFEGRYHVIDNGRSQLESLKARLLQVIESTRGDRSGALSLHWRGVQRAAVPPWSLVPFWVAAALTLLIAFLIFLWFNYRLASRSDELFAAINAIRLPKMPSVVAVAPPKPRLRQFLEPEIREGLVEVNDQADRSTVTLRGDGLFEPASTEVKPRYVAVIQRVASALNEVSGKVVVNGYSDNQPIRTARFPSNWHLSQERAQAVAAMLQRTITDGSRVKAEGRAESDPVAPNSTPEGRALNRRVEIVLLVPPQARDAELQLTPGPAAAGTPAPGTPKN